MSCFVHVLQDGYSRWHVKSTSMFANGTSTLIRASQQNIIVDTLGPWDREKLSEHLAAKQLSTDDIALVVGTHLHTDHIGNLNLFSKATHIVGDQRCKGDYFEFDILKGNKSISLTHGVELVFTPGHTDNDVSVVVHNVDKLGTVAVVGDLFESQLDLEDESLWREAGSVSPELQTENRNYILSIADYIVPGHGPMFRVNK